MGTFVQAMFWWCAAEAVFRVLMLCGGYYPRVKEVDVSDGVVSLCIWGGISLWAAYLLWG